MATPLTDRPGFLVFQLGRHAAARFAARLAALDLQPRHFWLLSLIAGAEGETQQQLADAMGIHRNAMVSLVDDLEHRGLVERRRHPADRRAHAVHLAAAGRDALARANRAADENDAELLAGLDAADRRRLIALLQRLAHEAQLAPAMPTGPDHAAEGAPTPPEPRGRTT